MHDSEQTRNIFGEPAVPAGEAGPFPDPVDTEQPRPGSSAREPVPGRAWRPVAVGFLLAGLVACVLAAGAWFGSRPTIKREPVVRLPDPAAKWTVRQPPAATPPALTVPPVNRSCRRRGRRSFDRRSARRAVSRTDSSAIPVAPAPKPSSSLGGGAPARPWGHGPGEFF
jgi:hypothetical protein